MAEFMRLNSGMRDKGGRPARCSLPYIQLSFSPGIRKLVYGSKLQPPEHRYATETFSRLGGGGGGRMDHGWMDGWMGCDMIRCTQSTSRTRNWTVSVAALRLSTCSSICLAQISSRAESLLTVH